MLLGAAFSLLGGGLLIWLMLQAAIFALPLFAGVSIGRLAYDTGARALGSITVGAVAAGAALGTAQLILAATRSTALRLLVALAFAAPAAFAGYRVVLDLALLGGTHGVWQPIFAGIGAVIISGAALTRLATPSIPARDARRAL